ncbi:topoisomerase DNA-binding C4 zinc finger domain-containing protein [Niallia sp.]|uniref:topoisomerase DNA-binding C4 zinc finger domain-containing protein n=1 Tax=Niallia sp. TaxID=2837523 RepID=UPI0037C8F099
MNLLASKLSSLIITTKKLKKQTAKSHVKWIRTEVKENNQKVKQNICLNCGNPLVIRKGKNSSFTGCSGFPKCRFY